jgi:hypothetical protein
MTPQVSEESERSGRASGNQIVPEGGLRFWIEAGLAALAACLFVLTLITREWVEALTGWDPDGGSGALEWALVVALLANALLLGGLARGAWKRRLAGSS